MDANKAPKKPFSFMSKARENKDENKKKFEDFPLNPTAILSAAQKVDATPDMIATATLTVHKWEDKLATMSETELRECLLTHVAALGEMTNLAFMLLGLAQPDSIQLDNENHALGTRLMVCKLAKERGSQVMEHVRASLKGFDEAMPTHYAIELVRKAEAKTKEAQ